jgi:chromodomain-helicase-DNA-binding protein 7
MDITELTLDNDLLKGNLNTSWTCDDCSNNLVACLICKNKGLYYGAEYKKNKKGKSKKDEEDDTSGKNSKKKNEVTKCSTANCAKYFHPKCIEEYDTKKLFKYIDANSLHFRCSLHYCNICGISGDTMSIFQCVRCPKALHTRCMDKEKVVKISKKQFICDSHFKNKKDLKKVSERFVAPTNTLKKFIKAEKV